MSVYISTEDALYVLMLLLVGHGLFSVVISFDRSFFLSFTVLHTIFKHANQRP